jgi:hypothetical protein
VPGTKQSTNNTTQSLQNKKVLHLKGDFSTKEEAEKSPNGNTARYSGKK